MLILYVRYELDDPEIVGRFLIEQEIFCFSKWSEFPGYHTTSFSMGNEGSLFRVVRDIN